MAHLYVLKKLPVWPVVKVTFIVFLVVGIIIGIFYALLLSGWSYFANSFMASEMGSEMTILRGLGFVMVPFFAVIYAVFAAICTLIMALLYNFIASAVGGIEMHLEDRGAVGWPVQRKRADQEQEESSAHVPESPVDGF